MYQTTVDADQILAAPAAKAIAILKDSRASVYEKAKACQRLAAVGDKSAVAPLAALLTDAQLSHYARTGLEPNPDPAASDALRAALEKTAGVVRIGIINSLGHRRDVKAIGALSKLRMDADAATARAADAALARIRPSL